MDKLEIFQSNQKSTYVCVMIHIRNKGEVGWYLLTCLSPPVIYLLTVPRQCFFCGSV